MGILFVSGFIQRLFVQSEYLISVFSVKELKRMSAKGRLSRPHDTWKSLKSGLPLVPSREPA